MSAGRAAAPIPPGRRPDGHASSVTRADIMEKKTAFSAQELGRAHAALLYDLQILEQVLQSSGGPRLSELRSKLAAIQTHITTHFDYEEQSGWANSVLMQQPRLEHAVESLLQEHRELVAGLETLLEEAVGHDVLPAGFGGKVLRWIQRVRAHEARENDLLERAFIEDLGTGD
jgi:AraC-like DNA-binding protein